MGEDFCVSTGASCAFKVGAGCCLATGDDDSGFLGKTSILVFLSPSSVSSQRDM